MTQPDNLLAEAREGFERSLRESGWSASQLPGARKTLWYDAAVAAIAQALKRAEDAERERDEARSIVYDIHWMAQRYADGRKSYAPGHYNDAIDKARGWLDGIEHARDGMLPDYASIEAQRDALTQRNERLAAALRRIGRMMLRPFTTQPEIQAVIDTALNEVPPHG